MQSSSSPRRAVPEANPLNSHGPARKLVRRAWYWQGVLVVWFVFLMVTHGGMWELIATLACIAVTGRYIHTLRRL